MPTKGDWRLGRNAAPPYLVSFTRPGYRFVRQGRNQVRLIRLYCGSREADVPYCNECLYRDDVPLPPPLRLPAFTKSIASAKSSNSNVRSMCFFSSSHSGIFFIRSLSSPCLMRSAITGQRVTPENRFAMPKRAAFFWRIDRPNSKLVAAGPSDTNS